MSLQTQEGGIRVGNRQAIVMRLNYAEDMDCD